ncbi:PRC-barrel domain containing protein [Bacillus luteolus]|uniref:PRC-barrel domain containing protein n=1 Tax=Litchfieldia luteola TaxID=682179 RepID=A0ABR9QGX6_9BACI|nr:PRC-barrel domain-containing protein [Cytobacillus luteolus]MBE4907484.1 PRC-barrel domain containing protein [Cytobacillus luteolus]MBP1944252.1 sporulation protein YlmC with PRC-barrel domain [Cytobacillus luteolus]
MLHEGNQLKKFDIHATDGSIGTVHDLFFDDEKWTTRYLVVDTMKWLPGRKVLVSPMSIQNVNVPENKVELALTKEKIKNSPDIDTDKPVSKQKEIEVGSYYGYPPYRSIAGTEVGGQYLVPGQLAVSLENKKVNFNHDDIEKADEPNLRSMKEVTGYHIHAVDGNIGHVEDFIICPITWALRYMVVDTKNWWPGKKVLVSPDWIKDVRWADRKVHVDLSVDTIKSGPEYEKSKFINREFEEELYDKYNKRKYWY